MPTPRTLLTLARAGVVRPRPLRLFHTANSLRRYGTTPAAGYTANARSFPDRIAVIDERGQLSFKTLDERTNALARAWAARGIGPGDGVAILCRNHRGFVEAVLACSKLGADALLLNTAFSGPQLADVIAREQPKAVVHDDEFELPGNAWSWSQIETQLEAADRSPLKPPVARGRAIILTSGTTGEPKGAARSMPRSIDPIGSLLSVIPLRAREPTMIAAPLFHSWGFVQWALAISLGSTVVLRRRFDAETTLALTAQHGCTALIAVPVMIQRILALDDAVLRRYDLSRVRTVALSGSALPGAISSRWMDHFGENLFNLYGSTEVAWATVATPRDLREAPGTAGRPPRGSHVRIYDDAGRPASHGRIFVGNDVRFEGYTGGGGKEERDGLLASGDVGHFDAAGRLFIDGRDDDMIVSGGENVFPGEVEDLLHAHERIAEAAVIGVADERFGQRLKAVVVRSGELTEDDVRAYVKANLAGFKVPRDVEFVDALPRTATGKVLKRELL